MNDQRCPVYVTRNISEAAMENLEFSRFVGQCLVRFTNGDWGDVDPQDAALNDEGILTEGRVMGYYRCPLPGIERVWIITEGSGYDRYTTVLFPEDY